MRDLSIFHRRNTMKFTIPIAGQFKRACAAALLLGSAMGVAAAPAHEKVDVDLLTTVFGTGSYVLGSALEEISKKSGSWLHINASESPGFVFNIKKLDRDAADRKNTIVGSGAGVAGLAATGHKPFDKKYSPPLQLIANYYIGTYWLATLNPDIKTVNDLAGKKVALGRAAQINWAVQAAAVITEGYGVDNVNIQYVGTQEAIDALLDGTVDASIVGGYYDPLSKNMVLSPQTVEFMASGRAIQFLPMSEEAIDKAVKSGVTMLSLTIEPGSIDGVDQPLNVIADTVSWMVSPEFPDDLAYETTKIIIDNVGAFGDFHALGKLMSPKGLVYGWKESDIHPGALKAYKEAGIVD